MRTEYRGLRTEHRGLNNWVRVIRTRPLQCKSSAAGLRTELEDIREMFGVNNSVLSSQHSDLSTQSSSLSPLHLSPLQLA